MPIDAATKLSDFSGFLTPQLSQPYFDEVAKVSTVQRLARKVPLGVSGQAIPVVTSKPTASWVEEGNKKPTTKSGLGLIKMTPKKIAAIAVVSAETVRANPGNYVSIFKNDIAEAFALAFDSAALHGTDSPFETNVDKTTKTVALGTAAAASGGIYGDAVSALDLLIKDKRKLTGFAFDTSAEAVLLNSYDTNGRPLLVEPVYADTALTAARLLGRSAMLGDGVADTTGKTIGYAGDWTKAVWGALGGITYKVSTEASVTINGQLVSLFENNLVAILAEAEFGFAMAEANAGSFVKLTAPVAPPAGA